MESYVLFGAGSAMFTRGLLADLIERGDPCRVGLVDIDPGALETAERLAKKMVAARQAPIEIVADIDRRKMLPEATAVICTVGVGGRRAWEQDVFIPRRYGINQPVGDSVMPGGTSRALRMIPAMVDIAQDALELAPDALFFNYGNPMAPVCRAVRQATGANIVGLCHGVHDVGRYLARLLGVSEHRFRYTAIGMNHLTWFVETRIDGLDAMPRMHEIAEERLARWHGDDDGRLSQQADDVDWHHETPFSWYLLHRFGGFPAALDRHVTEFFPQFFGDGSYYGHKLGFDAYSFEKTISNGDAIYAEMREDAMSPNPLGEDYFTRMGGEHEQVVDIVHSIRRDAGDIYSVNLPNEGQFPNLPLGAIIEGPAVADGAGLRHISQPKLPSGIVGCLATRLAWVETVVEAALEGSRSKFVQALILDGAVKSVSMAESLADDLLQAQSAYLPQFDVSR